MKKLPVIAFILAIAFSTNAQDVKFGVYITPQISWLSPEAKNIEKEGSIVKFAGGLVIDKYFAKNYALSTGLSIGGQGGKLNYLTNSGSTLEIYDTTYNLAGKTVRYDYQYITVPLGLKLQSNEIGYLRFHVIVGFTNQFRIKANATDLSDEEFKDDSIKEETSFYNLGYHFGGGIDYALGEDTSIFLTLVYDNGFVDVIKEAPSINSRVISIRLGINF